PSELTHFTALFIANLLNEAVVPPGVVNIVNGYGSTVSFATSLHPDVDKVAFTGSTITGRKILTAAKSNLKVVVTLELGGKGPTIVSDDADLEQAIKWANDTTYGLAENLFTENSARAIRVSNALEAGALRCTQVKAVHIKLGQRQ
ncbi:Aldehyde dehydrogenase, partial [Leucoagaricus sp. SymC.cos]